MKQRLLRRSGKGPLPLGRSLVASACRGLPSPVSEFPTRSVCRATYHDRTDWQVTLGNVTSFHHEHAILFSGFSAEIITATMPE